VFTFSSFLDDFSFSLLQHFAIEATGLHSPSLAAAGCARHPRCGFEISAFDGDCSVGSHPHGYVFPGSGGHSGVFGSIATQWLWFYPPQQIGMVSVAVVLPLRSCRTHRSGSCPLESAASGTHNGCHCPALRHLRALSLSCYCFSRRRSFHSRQRSSGEESLARFFRRSNLNVQSRSRRSVQSKFLHAPRSASLVPRGSTARLDFWNQKARGGQLGGRNGLRYCHENRPYLSAAGVQGLWNRLVDSIPRSGQLQ